MSILFNRLALATVLIGTCLNSNLVLARPLSKLSFPDESVQVAQLSSQGFRDLRGDGVGEGRFLEQLNLTSQQQQDIQQIRQKYQPEITDLRNELRTEREKLAQMMSSNDSESSLRSQHQKIVSLDQELHELGFQSMLEMRGVLTLEQRQEFAKMMGERKSALQNRFKNRSN